MDAFAVSVSCGLCIRKMHMVHAFRIAFSFGLFQALMPVVGFLAGHGIKPFIGGLDHWVAFALLSCIGAKMIWEARNLECDQKQKGAPSNYRLVVLSLATSLDALAVGLTLPFLQVSIIAAPIVIGIITFTLSYSGVYLGNRFGHIMEGRLEEAGGIVLILIGTWFLIEALL